MKKKFMLLALIVLGSVSAFAEETPVLELKQTVVTSDSFGTSVRETTKNMTVVNGEITYKFLKLSKTFISLFSIHSFIISIILSPCSFT